MHVFRWLSSSWSMHRRTSNTNRRWVAHIKEAARQTAPREADLPQNLPGRKSGLSALPHPADVGLPCGSPSGLPTNCGTPFSTLPESLTSLAVHLGAHLCSPCLSSIAIGTKGFWWELDGNKWNLMGIVWGLDENKRILMGYWWEYQEYDENFLRTWWEQKILMGYWREQQDFDGNKRILMEYWWEQEEFDGNCMGLDGKSSPHPFKNIRNSP
jgi:hypothetical protein